MFKRGGPAFTVSERVIDVRWRWRREMRKGDGQPRIEKARKRPEGN